MDTTNAEPESTIDTSIASSARIRYKKILVPHDGSEMADSALKHAIYLSNISEAEIIILNVVGHLDSVDSSAVLATSREGNEAKKETTSDYEITLEGQVKNMVEEKTRLCKQAELKSQESYKIQTGKPVEEIIKVSEEMNVDLVVMASSRSSSLVRRILGSTVRKVIDNIKTPILVIHE